MSILDAGASLLFPGGWEASFLQQFRASRDSVPSLETVSTEQKKRHCILRERHNFFSVHASGQDLQDQKDYKSGLEALDLCLCSSCLGLHTPCFSIFTFLRSCVLSDQCLFTPFLQFCKPPALCWVLGTQGQIRLRQHWWICRILMEP